MSDDRLTLEISERIATITLNRPEVLNALNRPTVHRLAALLQELGERDEVRVIILTGGGGAFSSGDDLQEAGTLGEPEFLDLIAGLQRITRSIREINTPVIAAVDGYALGGGLEIAASCDLRICTERSVFGMPEVSVGQAMTNGSSFLLSRIVGEGRARELIFTGESINAEEAYRIGLVNRVVPRAQLKEAARQLASRIASRAASSVRAAKRLLDDLQDTDLAQALALETETIAQLYGNPQYLEGFRAFLEKRAPVFDDPGAE